MDPLTALLLGIWLFFPAFVPNSAAVLVGGGAPIDGGGNWKDGKRLFGDGKTWRGFFGGVGIGIVCGFLWMGIASALGSPDYWGFFPFWTAVVVIVCLSFGAMLGDLTGSFVKRRFGKDRGANFPLLDMYGFVLMAILFVVIFEHGWFLDHYFYDYGWLGLIAVFVATAVLHRGTNIIGYKMGKKKVPW